jgi:cation-transporting ATPase E
MRIANKGALVQQINSVESLCHVTVLCLDKTGTLTTNRIQLDQIKPINVSSNLAESKLRSILGDFAHSVSASNRTNQAIVEACEGQARTVHEEAPFSSARKWSALSFNEDDLRGTYVMGAPEILQPHLEDDSTDEYGAEWAARGLRVLLFAYRPELTPLRDADGEPQLPKDLFPLSVLIFSDELRPEAKETMAGFRKIGVNIKIISGDNPHTVSALAKQAGLEDNGSPLKLISGPELAEMDDIQFNQAALDTSIFGRITPHQKEHLVQTLRDSGHYVAMTGDGVNDVLALKRANLGIAMQDGSQATRSVADIVLLNNSFAVLPDTFSEGQRILNGMQDILKLYLTRIIYLTLLIAAIMRVGPGFPFSPKQSSILSIITLAIPAFALALWARRGPVPEGRLINRLIHFIVPAGITMFAAGLVVYLYFLMTTFDFVYAQHTLTYALIVCGLLLIIFVEPPIKDFVGGDELSSDRRPTWLAIGLFLLFLASFVISPLRDFWGLMPLRQYSDYLVIGVVVIFWALALRYIWRARFLEKYLDVDFGGPREF